MPHRSSLVVRTSVAARKRLQRLNKYLPRFVQKRSHAPLVACCVYRSKNTRYVEQLISQLPPGCEVRLHALDSVSPSLAPHTMGVGRGARMPLLMSLIDRAPLPDDGWLIIFDDDATFARRGRTRFLDVALAAGFDISQPAIDPGQPHSFSFMVARLFSIARRTRYVEIGPVVAFSPDAIMHVLPFPSDAKMGWGVDILWSVIAQRVGLSQGIVDAEPILHHGPVAAAYDTTVEGERFDEALKVAGLTSLDPLMKWTHPRWLLWRRTPPWVRG